MKTLKFIANAVWEAITGRDTEPVQRVCGKSPRTDSPYLRCRKPKDHDGNHQVIFEWCP